MLYWSGPSYQVSLHCGLTLPHVMLACGCTGCPGFREVPGIALKGACLSIGDGRHKLATGWYGVLFCVPSCTIFPGLVLAACWFKFASNWSCLRPSADWMGAPRPTIQMPWMPYAGFATACLLQNYLLWSPGRGRLLERCHVQSTVYSAARQYTSHFLPFMFYTYYILAFLAASHFVTPSLFIGTHPMQILVLCRPYAVVG